VRNLARISVANPSLVDTTPVSTGGTAGRGRLRQILLAEQTDDPLLEFLQTHLMMDSTLSLMPLWSPFAGGWQCSTFASYETPAATEGHLLGERDCVLEAFQRRRYLRHTATEFIADPFWKGPRPTLETVYEVASVIARWVLH
jgi:hypothetical protein